MYLPSTYLVIIYFPTYLSLYETYFLHNWLPRWNHILTQLRFTHNWVNNMHPVDGMLVGVSSLWPNMNSYGHFSFRNAPLIFTFYNVTCKYIKIFYHVLYGL
jgi:hypothetical protein